MIIKRKKLMKALKFQVKRRNRHESKSNTGMHRMQAEKLQYEHILKEVFPLIHMGTDHEGHPFQ